MKLLTVYFHSMRWIALILFITPTLSFSETRLNTLHIEMSGERYVINDVFSLTIRASGTVDPFNPDQLSLSYPKRLTTKDIEMVNVSLEHSFNNPQPVNSLSKTGFSFKLIFYFKAKNKGRSVEIPNLPIGFLNSYPFMYTPKREVQIFDSYFSLIKPYLIIPLGLMGGLFIFFWLRFTPPKVYLSYLEIITYNRFLRLEKRRDSNQLIKMRALMIRYIKKKVRTKLPMEDLAKGDFTYLPYNQEVIDQLNRFWQQTDYPSTDKMKLQSIEENFKSLLFIFRELT
ncbi:MAG: hypothetical protein IEMM0008_1800 [bacterium]|nr:MAG: hypothetical protein IEMM0008_1800 [bacterium]